MPAHILRRAVTLQRYLYVLNTDRLAQIASWRLNRERLRGHLPSSHLLAMLALLQAAAVGREACASVSAALALARGSVSGLGGGLGRDRDRDGEGLPNLHVGLVIADLGVNGETVCGGGGEGLG